MEWNSFVLFFISMEWNRILLFCFISMEWASTHDGIYWSHERRAYASLAENIRPQPLLSFREHPSTGFYLLSHILTYYYFPDTPTHPTMRGACPLTWARAWKGELWWNWGVGSFEEEVKMGRSRKESRTGPSISLKGDHKLDWMNNCSTSIMFRRALRSTKFSGHREGDKSWLERSSQPQLDSQLETRRWTKLRKYPERARTLTRFGKLRLTSANITDFPLDS